MKLLKLHIAVLFVMTIVWSCKRENPGEQGFGQVSSTSEMKVPEHFDYATTREVQISFSTVPQWSKEKLRLDLYDFRPSAGGDIIMSEFLDANGKLAGTIQVPVSLKKLFVVLNYPNGNSEMAEVETKGNSISYDFGEKRAGKKIVVASPDCNSGCTQSYNNYSQNSNVSGAGVHCFTGSLGGKINVWQSGVTIRICGSGTINSIALSSDAKLEITDGSAITIKKLHLYTAANEVVVYPNASVTVEHSIGISGTITNYGVFDVQDGMSIYSSGSFVNNGTSSIEKGITNSNILVNNGDLSIGKNLHSYSQSTVSNSCKMTIADNFTMDKTLNNNGGYISIGKKLILHNSGIVNVTDGAMVTATDIVMGGSIKGSGSTSLVRISSGSTHWNSATIEGAVEYCDANGIEVNQGTFSGGATQACNVYIPTSPCNPTGNGIPQIADSDNDGVNDNVDLYPNDPTASGAIYYPSKLNMATLAFEDLWPGAGDYDFNDLVVSYSHTLVTDVNNKVVRLESKFITKAIGASLVNGLGFQLDVPPSAIAGISGQHLTENVVNLASNGTELSQSKATIIVFDNAFETIKDLGGTMYVNTLTSEASKTGDTLDLTIVFTSAQDPLVVGQAPFNPFIFRRDERGREIHLPDNSPTELVNTAAFGSAADDTDLSKGRYYKTENNHPWAINIPQSFQYPLEKTDIVEAYLYFSTWAQSGGTQAEDWYLDLSGYKNPAKLY